MIFLTILSAAAGVGLYKLSPSLLDIGRNIQHAADNFFDQTADIVSAEPVLRGTVFDRNLQEMAVSYRLYSLFVRPAEIKNYQEVARILADVTGYERDQLLAKLNEAKSIVNIAEQLEQSQVDLIKNAGLKGIYIKPVEERFYPAHEVAANLIGFTGKGMGLAGVEGAFDIYLQEGEFRTDSLSGIKFRKTRVLGREKVDIILTIDLEMQKRIEKQLKQFLAGNYATKGIALVMNPKDGSILSLVSQPSYNPNYYWRTSNLSSDSNLETSIDQDLLRQLKTRILAYQKNGDSVDSILPETVAAGNYGTGQQDIEQFNQLMSLKSKAECLFPACDRKEYVDGKTNVFSLGLIAAGLVNGGWWVSPHVLSAVFDHGKEDVYLRNEIKTQKDRMLSPAMGIRARRDLMTSSSSSKNDMILLTDSVQKVRIQNEKSEYILQEGFVGAVPAKSPEFLLVMVTQQDDVGPTPQITRKKSSIEDFGKTLLGNVYKFGKKVGEPKPYVAASIPVQQDRANYNQFLISSRIDFQEHGNNGSGRVKVMPQLVGLSLRKGLQRINEYDLHVKIQGSGQIVSQTPRPGEPLQGIGECVLTLDSEI